MSQSTIVRTAHADDADEIFALYRRVARIPGGLARLQNEVTQTYVEHFLGNALERGVGLVALNGDRLLGEIHAYSPGIFCFSHVFSDLTIAVDPAAQGQGVGRALFERLMRVITDERPEIRRVELITRESNEKAIALYESMGFQREGVFAGRIQNLDGTSESDIPMAWMRDNVLQSAADRSRS